MSTREPIGDLLDSLGVKHTVDEGDLVTDALVILKVLEPDGKVCLSICPSESLSWIDRLGMLSAAERMVLRSLDR